MIMMRLKDLKKLLRDFEVLGHIQLNLRKERKLLFRRKTLQRQKLLRWRLIDFEILLQIQALQLAHMLLSLIQLMLKEDFKVLLKLQWPKDQNLLCNSRCLNFLLLRKMNGILPNKCNSKLQNLRCRCKCLLPHS